MRGEKLTKAYNFNGQQLNWAVFGEHGGIHLHCNPRDMSLGGIEIHSKEPLHEGHKPHGNANCWLIGCQCYHDGSSLQWSEKWAFIARSCLFQHHQNDWWGLIGDEYAKRFGVDAYVDHNDCEISAERLADDRVRLAALTLCADE